MRKTKMVTETKEVEVIEDIICNKCGGTCFNVVDATDRQYSAEGLLECEITGGFFSKHLGDMSSYRFSMCEACLIQLFKTFRVPVEIRNDWHDWQPDPDYVPYPPPIAAAPLTEEEIQLLKECGEYEE